MAAVPKYGVQISEDVQVELDVAPNAPLLRKVELEWLATSDEAEGVFEQLGGRERFSQVGEHAFKRWNVPLTRGGEQVGSARLAVWLLDGPPAPDPREVAREEAARLGHAGGGW